MLVEGLRAFLPGSHFLAGQTPTEEFIGQRMQLKFLDVDREQSRLVVSHRKGAYACVTYACICMYAEQARRLTP